MKLGIKLFSIIAIIAIITLALALITCDHGEETHTHQWEWVETKAATATAEGEETETCATCGQTNRTRPIQKLPEQPQFRSEEITLNFLQGSPLLEYTGYSDSIMVSGTLLASEWNGIPSKVKTIIEAAYPTNPQTMDDLMLENYLTVGSFAKLGANVIVEKTTVYNEYEKYKVVDGQFSTLYLNVDALDELTILDIAIAVSYMSFERPSNYTGYATKPLTFGTTENPCSVTVTSEETFTTAEWNTLVDKVVAAIMRGYNKTGINTVINVNAFTGVFSNGGVTIVLSNSATHNCEVKADDYGTLYLKTSAIDTVDIQPAVWALSDNEPYTNP